jgi:hypothetical protein
VIVAHGTRRNVRRSALGTLLFLAQGCGEGSGNSQPHAVADVQQVMTVILEPAAETYWDAVGTVIDSAGTHETAPRTAEQWVEVYRAALVVAESGNLLMMEGRARDGGAWIRLSRAMVEAGSRAAKAAESRDPARVFEAGGELYEACTACHAVYATQTLRPSHDPQ